MTFPTSSSCARKCVWALGSDTWLLAFRSPSQQALKQRSGCKVYLESDSRNDTGREGSQGRMCYPTIMTVVNSVGSFWRNLGEPMQTTSLRVRMQSGEDAARVSPLMPPSPQLEAACGQTERPWRPEKAHRRNRQGLAISVRQDCTRVR